MGLDDRWEFCFTSLLFNIGKILNFNPDCPKLFLDVLKPVSRLLAILFWLIVLEFYWLLSCSICYSLGSYSSSKVWFSSYLRVTPNLVFFFSLDFCPNKVGCYRDFFSNKRCYWMNRAIFLFSRLHGCNSTCRFAWLQAEIWRLRFYGWSQGYPYACIQWIRVNSSPNASCNIIIE